MTVYTCLECGKPSEASRWEYTEVDCEVCGEHSALVCPECGAVIDMAYNGEQFPNYLELIK